MRRAAIKRAGGGGPSLLAAGSRIRSSTVSSPGILVITPGAGRAAEGRDVRVPHHGELFSAPLRIMRSRAVQKWRRERWTLASCPRESELLLPPTAMMRWNLPSMPHLRHVARGDGFLCEDAAEGDRA
jgi:hypothetical protein